jgi:hypothetical protein
MQRIAIVFAAALALAGAPAVQAQTAVVTINDPAGVRVVSSSDLQRWDDGFKVLETGEETARPDRQRRASVLDLLVTAQWMDGEAHERGVTVPDSEIQAAVEEYEESLPLALRRKAGLTRDDVELLGRTGLLAQALNEHAERPAAASITDAVIDAEIAKEGPRFDPELRDIRYIVIRNRAQAKNARHALNRGATWTEVAQRYTRGGRSEVARGVDEEFAMELLGPQLFRARLGKPAGPVRTLRADYMVFEVIKIRPRKRMPVSRQRKLIRQELVVKTKRQLVDAWGAAYTATWKARTVCAAGFEFYPGCSNWNGTMIKGVEWAVDWPQLAAGASVARSTR